MLRLSEVQNVECGAGGQLLCWLDDCKFFARKRVGVTENGRYYLRLRVYTADNEYNLVARDPVHDWTEPFLGGTVTRRRTRPGEDWFRKNDLPGGDCSLETLVRILGAIVFFEAKEMVKPKDMAALPETQEVMIS